MKIIILHKEHIRAGVALFQHESSDDQRRRAGNVKSGATAPPEASPRADGFAAGVPRAERVIALIAFAAHVGTGVIGAAAQAGLTVGLE